MEISKIQGNISALKTTLTNHPLFNLINSAEDLHLFMQHHVYAVWDFMSLLKSLQRTLTCVEVPWFPKGDANTRFLINEIVVGEESDVDEDGNRCSHFELYLKAMQHAGAPTEEIHNFIHSLQHGGSLEDAFNHAHTADSVRNFVKFTFDIINSGKAHVMAAVFTFGREDLIPSMFMSLVSDMNNAFPDSFGTFKYYLDRHIEVDGDHHSHLALEMTSSLCGSDANKWIEAEIAVIKALEMRKLLWDGVLNNLQK
jgi:hypothetical protein